MDGSPLHSASIAPFLKAPDKDLRSAALWVVAHHPDWAGVVLQYLSERLHDPSAGSSEMDSVRDALLAFSANPEAQRLIGDVLSDPHASEKQTLFLLDTVDASSVKELPAVWTRPIGALLASPSPNVRMRAVELVRSRAVPGYDEQLDRIAADAKAPDQLRATALAVTVG